MGSGTQAAAPNTIEEKSDQQQQEPEPAEPAETTTVSDGRRRGRRRVMKKRTVKDEEGYLGQSMAFTSDTQILTNTKLQKKRPLGNPSRKKSPHPRSPRSLHLWSRPRPRRAHPKLDKAVSCLFSKRRDCHKLHGKRKVVDVWRVDCPNYVSLDCSF